MARRNLLMIDFRDILFLISEVAVDTIVGLQIGIFDPLLRKVVDR
jgi:hypothetical protein